MLISIIIPVYNVERYLSQCLDSVLNQSYDGDYEVICVDDGSTDGSSIILEKYAQIHKNMKIISSKNEGTASARNIGIRQAKGKYLWFVDSDDWIANDAIQILSEYLNLSRSNPDVICFNGKLIYDIDGREESDKGIMDVNLTGWQYYSKYAIKSRKFHFVCVVLRLYLREFIISNNLFFEVGILHEDNLWVPQMCYYAEKVDVIPNLLYYYRIREGSKMRNISSKKIFDTIKVANRLAEFFIPKTDIDKSVVYREIAGEYFSVFMSDKEEAYRGDYSVVEPLINWDSYKAVSLYPRHRRIYRLLSISPRLFRLYLGVEKLLKR